MCVEPLPVAPSHTLPLPKLESGGGRVGRVRQKVERGDLSPSSRVGDLLLSLKLLLSSHISFCRRAQEINKQTRKYCFHNIFLFRVSLSFSNFLFIIEHV